MKRFAKQNEVLAKNFKNSIKLKHCSNTRQIDRLEAIRVFKKALPAIFQALKEIKSWDDQITSREAAKYKQKISSFDFIKTLAFIKLKLLKTALRNKMGDKFLKWQALIDINREYLVSFDEATSLLVNSSNLRIDL